MFICVFFFFKQKTAYEMRISDWSSDVCSSDLRAVAQARLGYLPENCPLYPEMTVLEHLDFAAELRALHGAARLAAVRRAMAATELLEKATQRIATLSRGYRQRVGVAQAILHQPKVLILDEPTNGLDPSQIRQLRSPIKRLAEHATAIFSTHILQEVQAVCDPVITVHRGRVEPDSPQASPEEPRAGKEGGRT